MFTRLRRKESFQRRAPQGVSRLPIPILKVTTLMELDCHPEFPELISHRTEKLVGNRSKEIEVSIPKMKEFLHLWNFQKLLRVLEVLDIDFAVLPKFSAHKRGSASHRANQAQTGSQISYEFL